MRAAITAMCAALALGASKQQPLGPVESLLGITSQAEWDAIVAKMKLMNATERKDDGAAAPAKRLFNCPPQPEGPEPTSVHRLRPRDIAVIGAIGDSLTAAFGATATSIIDYQNWDEVRGLAFPIGGAQDVNTYVTVPNIMKAFNPDIYGFSVDSTKIPEGPDTARSVLNLARSGARADDLPPFTLAGLRGESYNWTVRAQELLGNDRFKNSWKMLTVFIGSNNLCWVCPCSGCNQTRHETALFKQHVGEALDYLTANVPRLFVNLMLPIDTSRIYAVRSGICALILDQSCPCGASTNADWRNMVTQRTLEYQQALEELAQQYDTEDMAVVIQPWMKNTYPPTRGDGSVDTSYFAPDCFHFSRKAHSAAGVALWDNIITPVGQKDELWYPGEEVTCPSADQLLCTRRNRGLQGC